MHKIETILFGISFLLFGIASVLIYNNTEWGFFEITGIICPIIGLLISILGVFYEGKDNDDENE